MANMSYCCIENTAGEMEQVNHKFQNHQENVQSNQYEKAHLQSLYLECKEFCEEYEKYLNDTESYIRNHSEEEDDDE